MGELKIVLSDLELTIVEDIKLDEMIDKAEKQPVFITYSGKSRSKIKTPCLAFVVDSKTYRIPKNRWRELRESVETARCGTDVEFKHQP